MIKLAYLIPFIVKNGGNSNHQANQQINQQGSTSSQTQDNNQTNLQTNIQENVQENMQIPNMSISPLEMEFIKINNTTIRLYHTGSYWDNVRYFNNFPPLLRGTNYQQDKLDLFMGKVISTSSFNEHIYRKSNLNNFITFNLHKCNSFYNYPVLFNNTYEIRFFQADEIYSNSTSLSLIDLLNKMIRQRIPGPYVSAVKTIIAEKSNQFLGDGNLNKIIRDEFTNYLINGHIRPIGPVNIYTYHGFTIIYVRFMDVFLDDPNLFQRFYILDSRGQLKIEADAEIERIYRAWHRFASLKETKKMVERDCNLFVNWQDDNQLNLNFTNQYFIAQNK